MYAHVHHFRESVGGASTATTRSAGTTSNAGTSTDNGAATAAQGSGSGGGSGSSSYSFVNSGGGGGGYSRAYDRFGGCAHQVMPAGFVHVLGTRILG